MKKIFCTFLMVCMSISFVACEQNNISNKENEESEESEESFVLNDVNSELVSTLPIDNMNAVKPIEISVEEEKTVYLEIPNGIYSLQTDVIPYNIVNNTGNDIYVVMAPILEIETVNGWEIVNPVNVGFCGTPDRVNPQLSGELPLSWYTDSIMAGRYQLSFKMVKGNDYETIDKLSTVFELGDIDVVMFVNEVSPTEIKLTVTNDSEYDYIYGEHYKIEKYFNGKWREIDTVIQNYTFNDIGYTLEAMQTEEININWKWLYGELSLGKYRIIKDFIYIRDPGDYDTYNLSAEYVIGSLPKVNEVAFCTEVIESQRQY